MRNNTARQGFFREIEMSASQKISIYLNNFDVQNPSPTTQPSIEELGLMAYDVGGSGFKVGIFWSLHIRDNGDFVYNNGAPIIAAGQLQPGFAHLPKLIAMMKARANIQQLLFSTGGWTCESDFVNMKTLIDQYGTGSANPLYANFQALKSALSIDGIDIDLEANSSPPPYAHDYGYYTDTLVSLAGMLDSLGMTTTFCPYIDQSFWLGCLQKIYATNGQRQLVSAMNLQCYDGGAGNTQTQWVQSLEQSPAPIGIANIPAFVVPGYDAQQTPPPALQATFADNSQMTPGINGGFVWNYSEVQQSGTPTSQYASAIVKGIASL